MTSPSIPDAEGDIHLERAYIDYFVPGTPLSLTFGRLPTNEGPPNEIKDNTTRKSTWPKLMIDGESDGIIANLSLYKWTGLKNSIFRLTYAKIFQNYSKYTGMDLDDSRAAVAAFEMEVPGVKDSMVWISYADHTSDFWNFRRISLCGLSRDAQPCVSTVIKLNEVRRCWKF